MRRAACTCGQLSASCPDKPESVSLCHCTACQRRTGSTYGIAAFFARGDVAISGTSRVFVRPSDSGYRVKFYFCPECGSTVFWELERKPDVLAIAVGAFADPDFPAPAKAVYPAQRHRWLPELLSPDQDGA